MEEPALMQACTAPLLSACKVNLLGSGYVECRKESRKSLVSLSDVSADPDGVTNASSEWPPFLMLLYFCHAVTGQQVLLSCLMSLNTLGLSTAVVVFEDLTVIQMASALALTSLSLSAWVDASFLLFASKLLWRSAVKKPMSSTAFATRAVLPNLSKTLDMCSTCSGETGSAGCGVWFMVLASPLFNTATLYVSKAVALPFSANVQVRAVLK